MGVSVDANGVLSSCKAVRNRHVHFECNGIKCTSRMSVAKLQSEADVHPFAFPPPFNAYLVPRDGIFEAATSDPREVEERMCNAVKEYELLWRERERTLHGAISSILFCTATDNERDEWGANEPEIESEDEEWPVVDDEIEEEEEHAIDDEHAGEEDTDDDEAYLESASSRIGSATALASSATARISRRSLGQRDMNVEVARSVESSILMESA